MEAASTAAASSGPASCDLFSEIHLNELQKLEKQVSVLPNVFKFVTDTAVK
jgi:hypothetical protein